MAVSKIWPIRTNLKHVINYAESLEKTSTGFDPDIKNRDFKALQDVIEYAGNKDKTSNMIFCSGINCTAETAVEDFIDVKKKFKKTDGIQAWHSYLSFEEQDISPELAHQIGMEYAREVWGERFQVVVTTHLNTEHKHCHFVVNSISFVDGSRAHDETTWFKLKIKADRVCERHGLSIVKDPNRSNRSSYMNYLDRQGEPTTYNILRSVIDQAILKCNSMPEMKIYLDKQGYTLDINPNRKYWTIIPKGKQKPIRMKNLGEKYYNDALVKRLIDPDKEINERQAHRTDIKNYHIAAEENNKNPGRTDIRQSEFWYIRNAGLVSLFFLFVYMLNTQPIKDKKQYYKITPELRNELVRLNELSSQAKILAENNINTIEELNAYQNRILDERADLLIERNELRAEKKRGRLSEDDMASITGRIDEITKRLRVIKKEYTLTASIEERSYQIRDVMITVGEKQEEVLRDDIKAQNLPNK